MTLKNIRFIATISIVAAITIVFLNLPDANAQESTGYKMAENVKADFTFTFRDGVEHHQFPVFKMTSNLVDNQETTFAVEGIIGKSPHLHKALDEAFKFRLATTTAASSFEYNYRFFDVDVDITRDDETMRVLHYYNCEVLTYEAVSLNSNDYESYHFANSGFAVVDKIEFRCGGLNAESGNSQPQMVAESPYKFAEEVRTFVTFEFKNGIEKIEFPSFRLISGFGESNDAVVASFRVEGIMNNYPLLNQAIDNARKVSGIGVGSNIDFDALVEFSNGDKVLRGFDFRDCRVSDALITTESDKEEGYTGKSGFALVHKIDFVCSGLSPINSGYDELELDYSVWQNSRLKNQQMNQELFMANQTRIITTFTHNNGVETIEFPIFRQGNVLVKSNPTFELEGIVGDFPMLYNAVDHNLELQSVSGANAMSELFDVDVNIVSEKYIVRGFNYSHCRIIDNIVASDMNVEENYIKKVFALENTFKFECQGYHPNNPWFDVTFDISKAHTISSLELPKTDDWPEGFYVVKKVKKDKNDQLLFEEQKAKHLLIETYLQARF